MKTKLFTLSIAMLLLSAASFAQTKENLEKQRSDPKTIENAARADVRLINLKNMTDSSTKSASQATVKNECCNKKCTKRKAKKVNSQ